MQLVLHWAAERGRLLLVAGLVAGITLPDLALYMKDYLAHLVILLLFLNAFRIGSKATLGNATQRRQAVWIVLVLQLAVPLFLLAVLLLLGFSGPIVTALIVMASAASITGAPNITLLLGHDPSASQRLLILGTAMLPLTIVPVFLMSPGLGDPVLVGTTALRLLAVIAVAAGAAYFLRARMFPELSASSLKSVDGFSMIVMAVVVIGLMSALGPALVNTPSAVLWTLSIVFAANYGQQILCFLILDRPGMSADRVAISVVSGNRNMALFLAALPAATTDPILLFIACYQLPMYLTPIFMKPLYDRHPPTKQ